MLIAVGEWAGWLALLILSQFGPRRAAADVRPALHWIFAGGLLVFSIPVIGTYAARFDWARIHRVVGAIGLLLVLAGVTCLSVGIVKMRRRSKAGRPDPSSART
jgi:hypothetical protein